MNEIAQKRIMLALVALVAIAFSVLCPAASSVNLNNTESQALNGSADEDFNGTVYHLREQVIEVVTPVNSSRVNLTLPQKVDNITLYDENGLIVAINSSYRFWQGNSIYSLNFGRQVKGTLAYNLTSQGQQFVIAPREKGPVRIILPEGYTTGDRLLGIAWPPPNDVSDGDPGVTLTWNNTTKISYIEVNYYRKNAPVALKIVISILALAAIAILVQYHFSIKRLRASRIREEDNIENIKK